jgi:hypothetical protein
MFNMVTAAITDHVISRMAACMARYTVLSSDFKTPKTADRDLLCVYQFSFKPA